MLELLDYRLSKKQLLTPGKPVTEELKNSDEFLANLEKMKKILEVDGVGLAATQVNWSIQLFMLCIDKDDNRIEPKIFINPTIKTYSKNKIKMEEGCLSFWGLYLKVLRSETVTWSYETLDGNSHEITSSGFYARAVQHEIDHLRGNVFIQRASPAQRLKVKKWLKS